MLACLLSYCAGSFPFTLNTFADILIRKLRMIFLNNPLIIFSLFTERWLLFDPSAHCFHSLNGRGVLSIRRGGGGGCGYLRRRKGGDPRGADVCIWANYCLGGRALAHGGSSTCCSSAFTDLISVQAVCWHCCRLPGILHFHD